MIRSFLTRGLVMVFGYAYPAYECYKIVEKNKPDIEKLRFWCQYWILVAMLTIFERVGDTFVSWEHYDSFFRPYIAKHEIDIDRNLLELRTKAGDYAVLYWQKAANYSQTRVVDVLQYIASQSTTKPRSTQPPQQGSRRVHQPTAAQNRKAAATAQPSAASSTSSSDLVEEEDPSEVPTAAPSAAVLNAQKSTVTQPLAGSSKPTTSNGAAMPTESASSSAKEVKNTPPQDTLVEEAIRLTRARLRQTRAASNRE